jgi:cytochrome c biogenesis protein CcmG/thiol:disulfide interchange protein DsbE
MPSIFWNSRHIVLAVGITALVACSGSKAQPDRNKVSAKAHNDRKPAPDFTLTDSDGAKVKLADYRGKVVLLNFWATWCGPCQIEIPWFKEFEQQYKSKGFEVVGVSMDEDGWSAVKPYMAEHKLNYRILLGDDSVSQLYGGLDALPTTFIIDRDGRFAFPPHVGLVSKNEYSSEIESILGEKGTVTSSRLLSSPAALLLGTTK